MKHIILILIILPISAATSAQVLSLDSVLQVIDRQNPMLQEYDSRAKAMNAYTAGATSWMAPMVGVGPFWFPYPGQTVSEADRGMIMATIEQDIPNPAKLQAKRSLFASRAAVEEVGRGRAFNELRAQAKTLYYEWVVLEKKKKILTESERIVDLMLKLARIRYPYNQSSLASIYKTEGRLHEVQNMQLMTQAEIDSRRYQLQSLMNRSGQATWQVDTGMHVRFSPEQLSTDTLQLRNNRSDVRQAEKTIDVMRLNQQLQRAQAKPDFRIRFDHMTPVSSMMPQQFTLMGMISIPIAPWSSRMYKAEVRGMQHDIEAMQRGQEAILLEARGMLAGMAAQLAKMQQQLANYETRIIPALRKNYETLMLAYEENREQLPMVIDGWEALNMTQLEYLDKYTEYYVMIVRYEKELER
jgi:cobalt-zinc-cadmium efflux system outer membrane protein